MKAWYNRHEKVIWWVAVAGVAISYLGIWLDALPVMLTGIALALPLFIFGLQFCLLCCTFPLWYPLYLILIKRNGAPFQKGDTVRILRGPHKGKIVTVYQVWMERNQLRVELGEEEMRALNDVFGFGSVRKQS